MRSYFLSSTTLNIFAAFFTNLAAAWFVSIFASLNFWILITRMLTTIILLYLAITLSYYEHARN